MDEWLLDRWNELKAIDDRLEVIDTALILKGDNRKADKLMRELRNDLALMIQKAKEEYTSF